MTYVLLVELATQRQEELAARARAHDPGRAGSATRPTGRSERRGSGMVVGRLAWLMTRA